jgi:hypothetical protein
MQRLFAFMILVAGCGGLPGSSECSSHKDAASCSADPNCLIGGCGTCDGSSGFEVCYAKGSPTPQIACPALACPAPCNIHMDAQSCAADPRCLIAGCPDCNGGITFVTCYDKSGSPPPLTCPLIPPCPAPCSTLKDEASCTARTDCHSVYTDPGTCGCATPGCCAHFSSCDSPSKADCTTKNLTCQKTPPFCEGDYVPSVTSGCWEGCVHKAECG